MANPNPDQSGLEKGKWKPGQSGNPAGKPKGTKHLSTYIQEALTDENFELKLKDGTILKEMPIKAIIKTAVAKSVSGDTRAMEWLAKHGYGDKLVLEINDPRKEILDKYLGGDSAGQTQEA
jgi:hypothetical protein